MIELDTVTKTFKRHRVLDAEVVMRMFWERTISRRRFERVETRWLETEENVQELQQ